MNSIPKITSNLNIAITTNVDSCTQVPTLRLAIAMPFGTTRWCEVRPTTRLTLATYRPRRGTKFASTRFVVAPVLIIALTSTSFNFTIAHISPSYYNSPLKMLASSSLLMGSSFTLTFVLFSNCNGFMHAVVVLASKGFEDSPYVSFTKAFSFSCFRHSLANVIHRR